MCRYSANLKRNLELTSKERSVAHAVRVRGASTRFGCVPCIVDGGAPNQEAAVVVEGRRRHVHPRDDAQALALLLLLYVGLRPASCTNAQTPPPSAPAGGGGCALPLRYRMGISRATLSNVSSSEPKPLCSGIRCRTCSTMPEGDIMSSGIIRRGTLRCCARGGQYWVSSERARGRHR